MSENKAPEPIIYNGTANILVIIMVAKSIAVTAAAFAALIYGVCS